ncbi:glycerophosphodiester phosphodiesterase, partial [Pseudomonas syringae pv. pisi str. 1704B]
NRTAELLKFYERPAKESIETILKRNGYLSRFLAA